MSSQTLKTGLATISGQRVIMPKVYPEPEQNLISSLRCRGCSLNKLTLMTRTAFTIAILKDRIIFDTLQAS